jgi:hypothetical protein
MQRSVSSIKEKKRNELVQRDNPIRKELEIERPLKEGETLHAYK